MAELKSILKITGKLDGLSFYEMNGKIIVRKPGGFDGEKIRKDEKYEQVRKNASEFGRCSKFGGQLRRALLPYVKELNDPVLHGRMAKMLHDLMKLDTVSPKGERRVQAGLQHAESSTVLQNFVWNTVHGKMCRYDFAGRTLFFDRIPVGSSLAEVTLRFIHPAETKDTLPFADFVFTVPMPCSAFRIPEEEGFGEAGEGTLKFALIRFFDGKGVLQHGKTAVVAGSFL